MIGHLGILALTGASGTGKSTIAQLLSDLTTSQSQGQHPIVAIDMSKIIEWAAGNNDDLGIRVRLAKDMQKAGKFMPDQIIDECLMAWLEHVWPHKIRRNFQRPCLIVVGLPRRRGQNAIVEKFPRRAVVHVEATFEQTLHARGLRMGRVADKKREDDLGGRAVAESLWNEYVQGVIPAMNTFNGPVCSIRLDHPRVMLSSILGFLDRHDRHSPIGRNARDHAMHRLLRKDHPIQRKLDNMTQDAENLIRIASMKRSVLVAS